MFTDNSAIFAAVTASLQAVPIDAQITDLLHVNKLLAKCLAKNTVCPHLQSCRFTQNCWYQHPRQMTRRFVMIHTRRRQIIETLLCVKQKPKLARQDQYCFHTPRTFIRAPLEPLILQVPLLFPWLAL